MSQPVSLLTAAERHRRSILRRLLLAMGALALVVTATVIVTLHLANDGQQRAGPAPPQGLENLENTEANPAPEPEAGIWTVPPVSAGPLILPQPSNTEQGIPTGFPHSTQGAISAAAHYAEASVSLDEAKARALAEVAAAPSYIDAVDDFVRAVGAARRQLGMGPAVGSGEGDGGAYLVFQAQAYRVSDATPERVVIAVLGRGEGAGPATSGQGRVVRSATSYTMVWVDDDWHIAAPGEPLPDAMPAPRSSRAYQEGWRDLVLG
jgi:hypothetical protein